MGLSSCPVASIFVNADEGTLPVLVAPHTYPSVRCVKAKWLPRQTFDQFPSPSEYIEGINFECGSVINSIRVGGAYVVLELVMPALVNVDPNNRAMLLDTRALLTEKGFLQGRGLLAKSL